MADTVEPPTTQRWYVYGASLAIVLTGALSYWRSLSVPFVFDDRMAIVDNASIRHLTDWAKTFWAPLDAAGAAGRPLVNASLAVNYALGKLDVGGYHAFNLGIHVLAGLLLFGIARRTLERVYGDGNERIVARKSFLGGAAIALLWTVHPLQSESVICVIQRDEVMMGFCFLLSLYGFIRQNWILSVAACFLAGGCKEVAAAIPIVILAYDRTFVSGSFASALRESKGYYIWLFSSWIIVGLLLIGTSHRGDSVGFDLGVSSWDYLLTQCRAIILYLKLSFWPNPLVVDYGSEVVTKLSSVVLQAIALLFLLAASLAAFFSKDKRRPGAGFLGICFFLILAPSSSVVPLVTQTIAEHRMYLPLAAVLSLVVIGVFEVPFLRSRPKWTAILFCCVGVAGAARTYVRTLDYQDDLELWKITAKQCPSNPRVFLNLGTVSSWRGQTAQAIGYYRESLRLDPKAADTHYNLAIELEKDNQLGDAAKEFDASLQINQRLPIVHYEYGRLLSKSGDYSGAITQIEAALVLRPNSQASLKALAETHLEAANALASAGRPAEALPHYRAALALIPDSAQALNNFGNALSMLGRHDEAIEQLKQAVHLRPDYAEAHYNLGAELADAGRYAEAKVEFKEVVRLRPNDQQARDDLSRIESLAR